MSYQTLMIVCFICIGIIIVFYSIMTLILWHDRRQLERPLLLDDDDPQP